MNKPTFPRCLLPTIALGLIAMAIGIALDGKVDASDIRSVGVGAAVIGLGWLLEHRNTMKLAAQLAEVAKETAQYQLGRRDGFEEGYQDGRRVGRPTVVKMAGRRCGSCKRGSLVPVDVDSLGGEPTSARVAAGVATAGASEPVDSPEWEGIPAADGLASPN